MNLDAREKARKLAEFSKERMPALVDKIRFRIEPIKLSACYSSLSHDHLRISIFDYLVVGDPQSNLHVACQLELAAIAEDSHQRFSVGNELLSAMLSDNPDLIEAMAQLEPAHFTSARDDPLNSQYRVHMWQLVIQGEYEALQAKVERLAKNGRKAERMLPAQGKDFFTLFMRGDKQGLEDLISQHGRIKSADPLTEDFMSFLGCLEAKLCWLKGISVQIDSPLVPMGLMPIQPLEHYDDVYDFLEPGWAPPPQSILDKASRWLRMRRP
jgi:hypothetical protein